MSYNDIGMLYDIYLRAAAPAADPGRIGKPSERIYGTGLHPPPKKNGERMFLGQFYTHCCLLWFLC